MTQMGLSLGEEEVEYPIIEPVRIRLERHHRFVPPEKKPKRGDGRCQVCNRAHYWVEHHGFPEPLENDSGDDPMVWSSRKKMWQLALGEAIHATSLPRSNERIMVNVLFTFEDQQGRDRDNLVYPFCKFLGDTLVRGRLFECKFSDIDWESGPIGEIPPLKYTWRLLNTFVAEILETETVEVRQGRRKDAGAHGEKFDPKKPVLLMDPLGGWVPEDHWHRFEVLTFEAVYSPGVMACDIELMADRRPPAPWPPAA